VGAGWSVRRREVVLGGCLYVHSRTMALRPGFERVSRGEFQNTLFIAFRSGTRRFVVGADNAIHVARLLVAWAELGRDAAVLSSFTDRWAALSWLSLSAIDLPAWVELTCAVDPDDGLICLDETENPSPVFALLCRAGGQVVSEANTADVPQLVNTLKALDWERAIARMLPTMSDAETWLLSPRLPRWLMTPPPTEAPESTAARNGAGDAKDAAKDDVVFVSGGDGSDCISSGDSFLEVARALPPPPRTRRTILSTGSLDDSMQLPVRFRRHPVTGVVARGGGGGGGPSGAAVRSSSSVSPPHRLLASSRSADSRVSRGRNHAHEPRALGRWVLGKHTAGGAERTAHRRTGGALPVATSSTTVAARHARVFTLSPRSCLPTSPSASKAGTRVATPTMTHHPHPRRHSPSPLSSHIWSPSSSSSLPSLDGPCKKQLPARSVAFDMERLSSSIVRRKKNLFVTGGGGVGKTHLLHHCANRFRDDHNSRRDGLHVVAPTGVAAAMAGGVTLHAYLRQAAGCFDETLSEEEDAERLYSSMDEHTQRRLALTFLVLLDEVSMVSSRMYTVLCYCIDKAHEEANSDESWRIAAFGDFHQLPPVQRGNKDEDSYDTRGMYAFKSAYWKTQFGNEQLELKYVWRQED